MIIKTEKLKEVCGKILSALDANQLSIITETLQLKTEGNNLYLSVTNKEYFVKIKLELTENEEFDATVDANKFLSLVSKLTTNDVELSTNENTLFVKSNGNYKFPLVFDNDKLLELPEIVINNVTNTFNIDTNILMSILQYNSKELQRGVASKPVQKMYYIDQFGAITFTSGACVNSFTLKNDIRLLLNDRIVKLFKLFTSSEVKFSLGYDALSNDIIQTKVRFESEDVELTAITSCDDTLLNSVPAEAIRGRANKYYPYSVNVDRDEMLQTINRLLVFNMGTKSNVKPYSKIQFNTNGEITIWDVDGDNKETIKTLAATIDADYEMKVDLNDFKSVLEANQDKHLTINFGDHKAIILVKANIKNVIPEVSIV